MSVKIEFESIAQRKHVHQMIQEAAKEISEHTKLLETLFFLENGNGRQDGFGYVEKNNPDLKLVRFYSSKEDFDTHLEILETATIDDLYETEDKYEKQLESIVNQLNISASVIEDNIISQS